MPCIKPDGKPTHAGMAILRTLENGPLSPEDVSRQTVLPLFRVRSGLREMAEFGYVVMQDYTTYALSASGRAALE